MAQAMDDLPLRTIHVGLGWWGRKHLDAGIRSGLYEPAALVDPDQAALEHARAASGLPAGECFETLSDALAHADAEAGVVGAPAHLRADLLIEALASDLHVLVEPPPAAGLEDAQRCVFIAQNRGVRLMIAQGCRYAPEIRTARRALQSGDLGRPLRAELSLPRAFWSEQAISRLDAFLSPADAG